MGQAKNRGSFESRKQEALVRIKEEEQSRSELLAEKEAKLTPEQKSKRIKSSVLLASLMALTSLPNTRRLPASLIAHASVSNTCRED